jgi:hypothetical protein
MVIDLVGVLEDGGPRSSGVPENPRLALSFPIGSNVTLRLRVVLPSGQNAPAGTLTWTLKKKPEDAQKVFVKTATLAAGAASFAVLPADTKRFAAGQYVYDVWHEVGGVRNAVVPLSPFRLEAAATLP